MARLENVYYSVSFPKSVRSIRRYGPKIGRIVVLVCANPGKVLDIFFELYHCNVAWFPKL